VSAKQPPRRGSENATIEDAYEIVADRRPHRHHCAEVIGGLLNSCVREQREHRARRLRSDCRSPWASDSAILLAPAACQQQAALASGSRRSSGPRDRDETVAPLVRNSQRDRADAPRDFSSVMDASVAANSAALGYQHQPGLTTPYSKSTKPLINQGRSTTGLGGVDCCSARRIQ
jgi:hypothetical protein